MKSKRPPTQKKAKKGEGDDFQTPPYAIWPLLDYINIYWNIWEPACGKGNIVKFFREWGYKCEGTDILNGRDFLKDRPLLNYDVIITNPPYSLKTEFIARCYELEKPFALLLPYTALESPERQKYYKERDPQLILMDTRVKFETPSGEGSGSWFPVMWLTWGLGLPKQLNWAEINKPGKRKRKQ